MGGGDLASGEGGWHPPGPHACALLPTLGRTYPSLSMGAGITVFLADDNLIVRTGVKALIERHADLRVVGVAADYDGVVDGLSLIHI